MVTSLGAGHNCFLGIQHISKYKRDVLIFFWSACAIAETRTLFFWHCLAAIFIRISFLGFLM